MRSRTSDWYEVTVKYDKQQEDGSKKKVSETYIVDAMSCSEAEKTATEKLKPYIKGDFKIKSIKECPFHEVFFSDNEYDDKWYKAKLAFITLDEKSQKEKRNNVTYLVQASSLNGAVKHVDEAMGGTMIDYSSLSAQETKIMDVFEHMEQDTKNKVK